MNYTDASFINKLFPFMFLKMKYKYEIGLLFIQIMYPTHIRQRNDMVAVDCDCDCTYGWCNIFHNIVIISSVDNVDPIESYCLFMTKK